MKSEEFGYALRILEDAFQRLNEGVESAKDELAVDGVIQRFEFTFELFWKALRIFLENKGIICRTPRDIFKEAFRMEWLEDEEVFLNMLEDRNKSSHIYNRETSRQIFERVKKNYLAAIEKVVMKLGVEKDRG